MKKTFLFQTIQFSQVVGIQLIQFSISTDFVYRQLNVKTVLYLLYSYLHVHSASQRHNIKDRHRNEGRMIKTHEGGHVKKNAGSFFTTYLPLTLLQGFERLACERTLETERKLHILTPLLWPSRCVVIVLLMFNQRSWGPLNRGFSECPLGRVWPSLPHLVSTVWKSAGNCIGGFPSAPSVGCGLPYHIWSLLSGCLLATALGPKLNWVK